jgi:hypothetical protein
MIPEQVPLFQAHLPANVKNVESAVGAWAVAASNYRRSIAVFFDAGILEKRLSS